jgi:hypothetical protein
LEGVRLGVAAPEEAAAKERNSDEFAFQNSGYVVYIFC